MLFCRRWYIPIQARHSESIQASPGTARFVRLEAAATMFRTPFTDLVSPSAEHEGYRKCHKLSMQLALCKEAYGLSRAAEQCKAEDEDFRECMFGFKQRARVQLMQKERERQFKNGEREQKYAEPATMDGFNMRNPYS